jgi:hypothetical protein
MAGSTHYHPPRFSASICQTPSRARPDSNRGPVSVLIDTDKLTPAMLTDSPGLEPNVRFQRIPAEQRTVAKPPMTAGEDADVYIRLRGMNRFA